MKKNLEQCHDLILIINFTTYFTNEYFYDLKI